MVQHIPRLNFKKMSLPELQLWLIQKYIPSYQTIGIYEYEQ